MPDDKRCGRCGETKPLDQFHMSHARPGGRQFYCKPCAIAVNSTPEARARVRRHNSQRYHTDATYRECQRAKQRAERRSPQYRQKWNARYNGDPVFRAKYLERQRRAFQRRKADPVWYAEYLAKERERYRLKKGRGIIHPCPTTTD